MKQELAAKRAYHFPIRKNCKHFKSRLFKQRPFKGKKVAMCTTDSYFLKVSPYKQNFPYSFNIVTYATLSTEKSTRGYGILAISKLPSDSSSFLISFTNEDA